jgi:hypothetical protein
VGQLIVVVGLPGSGKSRLIEHEERRLLAAGVALGVIAHDYLTHYFTATADPMASPYLERLRADLADGKTCIIAHAAFTAQRTRDGLLATIDGIAPLVVRWVYFANDLDQCLQNIRWHDRKYNRHDAIREDAARWYHARYALPSSAPVIPVGVAGGA